MELLSDMICRVWLCGQWGILIQDLNLWWHQGTSSGAGWLLLSYRQRVSVWVCHLYEFYLSHLQVWIKHDSENVPEGPVSPLITHCLWSPEGTISSACLSAVHLQERLKLRKANWAEQYYRNNVYFVMNFQLYWLLCTSCFFFTTCQCLHITLQPVRLMQEEKKEEVINFLL